MNGKNYFEEIGAWPRSHNIAWAYVVGFVLSILLTLIGYSATVLQVGSQQVVIGTIIAAAVVQCIVQVYCFLHVGSDRSSRDRLIVLCFAAVIITILVSGSLWIMFSLSGRMMPDAAQMEQYMNDQEGF